METVSNTRNPILPLSYHVPDVEAHQMPDGKLYLYGSFDNREDVFCSEEYHVVSTADMKEWTIHSVALSGQDVPWFNDPEAPHYPGIDWSKPTPFIQKMLADMDHTDEKAKFEEEANGPKPPLLFAPDAIHKDGSYFLYFCMPDDSEGVAISDSPTGPFTQLSRFPIGGIDPAVFIDEDDQAYYFGGQLFSHGAKLNPDMTSLDLDSQVDGLVTEEEHFFHEGSSIRKIGDTYYFVYASIAYGKPTSLSYATSKHPLGPYTYGGVIINNEGCDPQSWNNHGSIQQFGDQWYVFYHRSSRNSQRYRRLCIEPITINPDGSIDEVKMTSQGLGKPFAPGERIYGYQACELEGQAYIDVDERHGEAVTNVQAGDKIVFRYIEHQDTWKNIEVEATGSATLIVLFNGQRVSTVQVRDGKLLHADLNAPAGLYEVTLSIDRSEDFILHSLLLA
ncbi:family 43 glycosylhydrolase [Streptococcus caprae]|uniref:Family 43 glycosylhydrolase n=1 Tax=Streptococcus caprae TaxID=1640501 RepID=A0ABV8CWL6_9STRE